MEADQINILAAPVLRYLQQVDHAQKARLARQLRGNVLKPDLFNGINFDFAFLHLVSSADLDVRVLPDPNTHCNLSAPDPIAKPLGEDHARKCTVIQMTAAGLRVEKSPFFRGWWMVAASSAGLSFGIGTILAYTFGVFAKPLASEFKAGRSSIALAVSLIDVVLIFASPGAGRLVDRYGARGVIVGSTLGLSACVIGLAYVHGPLWHLYALFALAGVIGAATTPVSYSRVIANWFDRRRGLALGLAACGVGLGAFITPSLAQFLIDHGGWRFAYLGLACACLAIAVPVVWIVLRTRPEEVGLQQDGAARVIAPVVQALEGMTVLEAFKTPTFWLLCFIFFCVAGSVNGTIAHLAPMLTDNGVSGRSAAFAASIFGVASIAGRAANGYLVDRFFAPRVAAALFAGACAGVAMLWSGVNGSAACIASALLGLAVGAEGDVMPYLVSRYFGMRSMGELFGCIFGVYTFGNATARYLFAAGFDTWGSYKMPLACGFIALVLAIAACFGLGKYRRP